MLSCLGIVAYSNTLNSPFQWDDRPSIADNPAIRDEEVVQAVWEHWPTRFVTFLTFALNYRLNNLDTFGYHIFNLTVHVLAAIALWWLTILTLNTPALKDKKISGYSGIIALFAGAIFISHPLQTQGVTYISQRAASLAALFYISSLAFYAKSRLSGRMLYYAISLSALVLAMFTKELAVSLPFAVILYEYCFLREGERMNWKGIAPFLAAISIIPVTMAVTRSVDFAQMKLAAEARPAISPWEYLLTQTRAVATYLHLLFVPMAQNIDYDYRISKSLFEPAVLLSLALIAAILAAAMRAFGKYRLASFGIFFFFLALLPESSLIPFRDVICEHRLYLPMAGFAIFLTSAVFYIFANKTARAAIAMLSVAVICYSFLTYTRNLVWKDEFTLWDDTVRKSPGKARPHNNRGFALQSRGYPDRALEDYDRALELDSGYADAYNNRGNIHTNWGEFDQAISDYNKAIELRPKDPVAYNNRSLAYKVKGDFGQAIADCSKAIELKGAYAEAYNNRGLAYQSQGDLSRALHDFHRAIVFNPGFAGAYLNRGYIFQIQGNFKQAINDYTSALEIQPGYAQAHNNRGIAYHNLGHIDRAILDYTRAIEIDPGCTLAYANRAAAYFSKKDYERARADVRRAGPIMYKINPQLVEDLKGDSGAEG
jgi:tetratricopeptide (TPR) repeat protein